MSNKIFLPKWSKVLVGLYNTPEQYRYSGKLHKEVGITTKHLRALIVDLERMNIVCIQTKSKIKYINLTDTGRTLAESFLKIYPALKR